MMQSVRSLLVTSPAKRIRMLHPIVVSALALILLTVSVPFNGSADDIPHENYDLVGSDLDFVIQLLKSSISYSEFSLMAMYNESMDDVSQNLTVVQGLLTPAAQLLDRIRDVATSYENLSVLIPPFGNLSAEMGSFSGMEVSLLSARDSVVSASTLENLTGDAMIQALSAIETFNSLIMQMNRTIDKMLISADAILNLTVDDERPFTDNQLVPLIEALRDLLRSIEFEVDEIIHGGVPWSVSFPFLLLWLSDDSYYLGDSIEGGGLLFYNGSFQSGVAIDLLTDGVNLTTAFTKAGGRYSFSYDTELNASWLGDHSMQATASTPNGSLFSDSVSFRVILIPTSMTLRSNGTEFSIIEEFSVDIQLKDGLGRAVATGPCHISMDGTNTSFVTDSEGSHKRAWRTSDLGYGTHIVQAFYEGELPYAPSSSNSVSFDVNIPTNVSIQLFSARYLPGYSIIGNGTLWANGTAPLPNQEVTLSIDGVALVNVTTDEEGKFSFSIPAEDLRLGGHSVKAELLHRDLIWRYSWTQVGFSVVGKKLSKYPFFPYFPGWGDVHLQESFSYIFIGPSAYVFWLLLLTLIGVTVKVLQIRKQRMKATRSIPEGLVLAMDKSTDAQFEPAISAEDFALDLAKVAEEPSTPNERIVLYYQRLLSFLSRRARISLKTSMTHWEVARLLRSLGYPSKSVDTVTVLFERAFYSGADLSDEDTVAMSASITGLVTTRATGGSANAV